MVGIGTQPRWLRAGALLGDRLVVAAGSAGIAGQMVHIGDVRRGTRNLDGVEVIVDPGEAIARAEDRAPPTGNLARAAL